MTAPLLTFVVAAYNVSRTLQRTLGSLATDVDPAVAEVLVIDDGSTDDTAAIAEGFCRINPNFRLVRQPNQGLGAVRNRGIDCAAGTYVTFCDSDDIFLPANHLHLVRQMQRDSADIGIGLGFSMIRSQSMEEFWDNAIVRVLKHLGPSEERSYLKFLVQVSACTKIFRRAFLADSAIRFTVGRLYEDVAFTTRALLATDRLSCTDLPLFIYDVGRNGAITTDNSARRMEIFESIESVITAANASRLSGPQNLCLLTALMRMLLWCLDNVAPEMAAPFALRILQTVVRFRPAIGPDDHKMLEPMITDVWDRRAFDVVKAIWISNRDGRQLMELLGSVRR
jgi:Glycosyl transferase family 2